MILLEHFIDLKRKEKFSQTKIVAALMTLISKLMPNAYQRAQQNSKFLKLS
jgi:hypothetical protein